MKYYKYEFDQLPEILKITEDQPSKIKGDVVILPPFHEVKGEYDQEGNEITPPVISNKIHVDIIYRGEPEASLEPYRVTPRTPDHHIYGMEELYKESSQLI